MIQNQSEPGVPELIEMLRSQGDHYTNLLALLDSFNRSANVNDTQSQAVLNSIQHQLNKLKGARLHRIHRTCRKNCRGRNVC